MDELKYLKKPKVSEKFWKGHYWRWYQWSASDYSRPYENDVSAQDQE